MVLAIAIFVAALAVIFTEKVHRTKTALAAALVVVLTGTLSERQALDAVDFDTIGLLAGMMIVVRQTERSGLFNYVAIRVGQLSKGRPLRLLTYLCLTTAVMSAFLDNLTTVLLVVPITFLLAATLEIPALPLVIGEVMASNIGGTATLIGDPPNILIAGASGLGFIDFLVNVGPVALTALVGLVAALFLLFRRRLQVDDEQHSQLMALDASISIRDRRLLIFQLAVLALILAGFFFQGSLGVEPATVALSGAVLLLFTSTQKIDEALAEIEWATLFFLTGLFIVVGGLHEHGVLREVAQGLVDLTGGSFELTVLSVAWGSAIASALVDNIPFTVTMIPVIKDIQELTGNGSDTYWWALSVATGFGGNGTLIAAAANVAAAGLAERAGQPISFISFLKVGIPVTIGSMVLASAYLWIFYLL